MKVKLSFQVPLAIFKSCLLLAPCWEGASSWCNFTSKQGFLDRCSWAAAKPLRRTMQSPSAQGLGEET